jgi:hypothetical protein
MDLTTVNLDEMMKALAGFPPMTFVPERVSFGDGKDGAIILTLLQTETLDDASWTKLREKMVEAGLHLPSIPGAAGNRIHVQIAQIESNDFNSFSKHEVEALARWMQWHGNPLDWWARHKEFFQARKSDPSLSVQGWLEERFGAVDPVFVSLWNEREGSDFLA